MGHLERGEKNMSFNSIVRVASALDVTLAELLGGIESGDAPLQSKKRQKNRSGGDQLDRRRALRELASLDRSVSALKAVLAEKKVPRRTG
jgi:hypothetical protein